MTQAIPHLQAVILDVLNNMVTGEQTARVRGWPGTERIAARIYDVIDGHIVYKTSMPQPVMQRVYQYRELRNSPEWIDCNETMYNNLRLAMTYMAQAGLSVPFEFRIIHIEQE